MNTGFVEWLIGVSITILGGIGVVFFHIYGKLDIVSRDQAISETRLRADIERGDKELDAKIELERESGRVYRESMIAQVSSLPTKEDIEKMETRIMGAIRANGTRSG